MTSEIKFALTPQSRFKRRIYKEIGSLLALLQFVLLISILYILAFEAFSPSLDFMRIQEVNRATLLDDPQQLSMISPSGSYLQARRVVLKTQDRRTLWVDYVSTSYVNAHQAPITIIIPDLTSDLINPLALLPDTANTIDVVYSSPRAARMTGNAWPSISGLLNADTIDDVWREVTTNPLTMAYAIQMGLHEAPYDVSTIIDWAKENLNADIRRIRLVGIGSGALVAAAAAERLQAIGMSVTHLALIYPPANLQEAIRENLTDMPSFLRTPAAASLALFMRRIELQRHLPNLRQGQVLIAVPKQALELDSYVSTPARALVPPTLRTTVIEIDHAYRPMAAPEMINKTRNLVTAWIDDSKSQ